MKKRFLLAAILVLLFLFFAVSVSAIENHCDDPKIRMRVDMTGSCEGATQDRLEEAGTDGTPRTGYCEWYHCGNPPTCNVWRKLSCTDTFCEVHTFFGTEHFYGSGNLQISGEGRISGEIVTDQYDCVQASIRCEGCTAHFYINEPENCGDCVDDDFDGLTDCEDTYDCGAHSYCLTQFDCAAPQITMRLDIDDDCSCDYGNYLEDYATGTKSLTDSCKWGSAGWTGAELSCINGICQAVSKHAFEYFRGCGPLMNINGKPHGVIQGTGRPGKCDCIGYFYINEECPEGYVEVYGQDGTEYAQGGSKEAFICCEEGQIATYFPDGHPHECIEAEEQVCDDGIDNDEDGFTDCVDVDDCEGQQCVASGGGIGVCMNKLCVTTVSAGLTVDPDYLDRLPVDKEGYLEEAEIPKGSGESYLVVSPYDELMCEANLIGSAPADELSGADITNIMASEIDVFFAILGVFTGTIAKCMPKDNTTIGGILNVNYGCNHTFFGFAGDDKRGTEIKCEVYPAGHEELKVESDSAVVARYVLYGIRVDYTGDWDNIGFDEQYNYFVEISSMNEGFQCAGKQVKWDEIIEYPSSRYIDEPWILSERLVTNSELHRFNAAYDRVINYMSNRVNDDLHGGKRGFVNAVPNENHRVYLAESEFLSGTCTLCKMLQIFSHELGHSYGFLPEEYFFRDWWRINRERGPVGENGTVRFPVCCYPIFVCCRTGWLLDRDYDWTIRGFCEGDVVDDQECISRIGNPPSSQRFGPEPGKINCRNEEKDDKRCKGMPYKDTEGDMPFDWSFSETEVGTYSAMSCNWDIDWVYPRNAGPPLRGCG